MAMPSDAMIRKYNLDRKPQVVIANKKDKKERTSSENGIKLVVY